MSKAAAGPSPGGREPSTPPGFSPSQSAMRAMVGHLRSMVREFQRTSESLDKAMMYVETICFLVSNELDRTDQGEIFQSEADDENP